MNAIQNDWSCILHVAAISSILFEFGDAFFDVVLDYFYPLNNDIFKNALSLFMIHVICGVIII